MKTYFSFSFHVEHTPQITPPPNKKSRAAIILKGEKQGETKLKQNLKIWISGLVTEFMFN